MKAKPFFLLACIMAVSWLGGGARPAAAAPVVLTAEAPKIYLNEWVQVLVDPRGQLSLEEISSPAYAAQFQAPPGGKLSFGYSHAAYWVRMVLVNPLPQQEKRILEINHPILDQVTLYHPLPQGGFTPTVTGDQVPFAQRDLQFHRFLFRLQVEPGATQVFYLRVQSYASVQIPLVLWQESHLLEELVPELYLIAGFTGIVLVMVIYHLVLFFAIRDPAYLHYTLFVFGMLMYLLTIRGVAYQYLWPESPFWNNQAGVSLWIGFAVIGGLLFSRSYLQTNLYAPLLHRVMGFAVWLGLAAPVIGWWDATNFSFLYLTFLGLTVAPLLITAGVLSLVRGHRPAWIFLLAFMGSMFSVLLGILRNLALLPLTHLTEHPFVFGTTWEIIFLSLALAYRFKGFREQKEQAQRELVESLTREKRLMQEYSETLEKKVKERARAIKDLLDNTGEGFFSFGADYKIHPDCSKACSVILQREIQGKDAALVLYGAADAEPNRAVMDMLFLQAGDVQALLSLLPVEVQSGPRQVQLEYHLIRANEPGNQDKIMVVMTDITQQKELQALLAVDERTNRLILAAARDKEGFVEAMNDVKTMLARLQELLQPPLQEGALPELFRIYHTIKGGVASYAFDTMAAKAHEIETNLEQARKQHTLSTELVTRLQAETGELEMIFLTTLERLSGFVSLEEILGQHETTFRVPERKISHLLELAKVQGQETAWQKPLYALRLEPVGRMLEKYKATSETLAQKLGKEIKVEIRGAAVEIDYPRLKSLFAVLIHLIRNAVDHGIEEPWERDTLQKPTQGRLLLAVDRLDSELYIAIDDDGRGMDPEELKAKAVEKGVIPAAAAAVMTPDEVLHLIFLPGFTTKDRLSEYSGRGVGLDAVNAEVTRLKGWIEVDTKADLGTRFTLVLPDPS